MAKLLFDVDGVHGNFVEPVLRLINSLGGYHYTEANITNWDIRAALGLESYEWAEVVALVQEPGFAGMLNLYPGSREFIRSVKDEHDIRFLTSDWRGSKTWVYDRNHWLVKHYGQVGKNVHHTSCKADVCGDMLVDDKLDNAVEWKKAWPDRPSVIWDRPWNQSEHDELNGLVRVSSFEEVHQLIAAL